MDTLHIAPFVASFFLSMLFIFVFRPFALWLNWVDKPNARKLHQSSVPVIGGLGVFLAVALALALSPQLELASEEAQYLLVGSGSLLLLGLVDDKLGLSAMLKLAVELLLAHYMYTQGIKLDSLHGLFGLYAMPVWAAYLLTVAGIVGVVNAYNLMDGIDGLAAGLGLVSLAAFGAVAIWVGQATLALICLTSMGGLLGFLRFNFSTKQKVFMGDAGSLALGFLLAALALMLLQKAPQGSGVPIALAGVLALPVLDSLRVYLRRIKEGKSPFQADRKHLHHLVLEFGMKHKSASLLISLAVSGLFAIALWSYANWGITVALAGVLLAFSMLAALLQLNSAINTWRAKILKLEYRK